MARTQPRSYLPKFLLIGGYNYAKPGRNDFVCENSEAFMCALFIERQGQQPWW